MDREGYQENKQIADFHYQNAETELNKLRKDPEKACQSCRDSMLKYMNAFLHKNGVEPKKLQTVSILLEQCKEVDPTFEHIDMSPINCKYELIHKDPCTAHVKLEECFNVTSNIRDLSLRDRL